jgi:glycosyl transferase family 25
MSLACLVISLPGSPRRPVIADRLRTLGVEHAFVDGVVAAPELMTAAYDDRAFRRRYGRSSTPSEVACVLAHHRAYAVVRDRGLSAAVILEDDAIPTPSFWPVAVATADRLRPGDIALLEHRGSVAALRLGREALPAGRELVYLHRREPWGATAYVVTLGAAERLRRFGDPVGSAPDDWRLFGARVVVRAVMPAVVEHDEARPSEIGAERFSAELSRPRATVRAGHHLRGTGVWTSRLVTHGRELARLSRAGLVHRLSGPRRGMPTR